MKVTIEDGELVIRSPIRNPPKLSKSGKSRLVTTGRRTIKSVLIDGEPVTVSLNAYLKGRERPESMATIEDVMCG